MRNIHFWKFIISRKQNLITVAPGKAAALSEADIMVFMTQDALPADRELIQNLTGALCSDEQIRAAYARQLPNAECSFVERYTRSFNYPEISCVKTKADLPRYGIKTYFCSNVCAAYKKDILRSLEAL